MSDSERIEAEEKPPPLWWVPIFVGGFGWVLAAIGVFTHNRSIMAVAMIPLAIGGIVELIQFRRGDFNGSILEPEQVPTPPRPVAALLPVVTSLVGVRIRHRDGISTVTEDLDTPMPRRTVVALDTHGRPERLCVSVDEDGNVIEAAVPGSEWAAAEAI
jgi:hypothetical protein